jgi:hypothetical protein
VAVGSGTNRVAYSYEGISWFVSLSGNIIFSTNANTVYWSQTQQVFLAGGDGGVLASSTDGITWTAIVQGAITGNINSVRYSAAAGRWVMGGLTTNEIATSVLVSGPWTGKGSFFSGGSNAVCYSTANWMAVGQGPTNTVATAALSAATFTGLGMVGFGTGGSAVARDCWYGNGTFILAGLPGAGATNTLAKSLDAITYTAITPNIFTTSGYCITWYELNQIWVGGGQGTNTLGYSLDGNTWVGLGSLVFTTRVWHIAVAESAATITS